METLKGSSGQIWNLPPSAKCRLKESADAVKRNLVHPIIKVNMRRSGNDNDLFWIVQFGIGVLREIAGVGVFSRHEQHRTRADLIYVPHQAEIEKCVWRGLCPAMCGIDAVRMVSPLFVIAIEIHQNFRGTLR